MSKDKDYRGEFRKKGSFSEPVEGRSNREGVIRERGGAIFKGRELGSVDQEGRIREKGGAFFKGAQVGRVDDKKAFGRDGVFFRGQKFGYVDDNGNVRQRDGALFRGRIIGKAKGSPEAALGFYVLKFQEVEKKVVDFESEYRSERDKARCLNRAESMLNWVPEARVLGDLDSLIRRLKAIEADCKRAAARNLGKKQDLCSRAEQLSSSSDWKTTAAKLKELQVQWKSSGHVAKDQADRLWQRFRKASDRFYDRRKQHFDKMEKERVANLRKKETLCARAESLSGSTDWKGTAQALKDLQAQWKQIGHVPKDKADAVWQRFRKASDRFYDRRKQHFDKMEKERVANLRKKETLCARAESLSGSTDWKGTAQALKDLQAQWKQIGHVPKDKADAVWQRFRKASDRFYDRRKQHFDKMEKERVANLRKKEALCARAESLSGSTDWKGTAQALRDLQAQWKQIGHVPKDKADAVWHRFRKASDRFYDRRKQHFDQQNQQREQNLRRKEELCRRAETLSHSSDWKSTGNEFRSLMDRWKSIGPVPREQTEAVWSRFQGARNHFNTRRQAYFEQKNRERERKQAEWQSRMRDVVGRKRDQISRLRDSIRHDEGNVDRWRSSLYNVRSGPREYEIRSSLESKIDSVESKIASKESKIRDLESSIRDIEAKLR